MSDFFSRPAPQQAIPSDLRVARQDILQALFGTRGGKGGEAGTPGALQALLGLTNAQTPGGDVLGPLSTQFHQNLADALSMINSDGPRFSSGNQYLRGQAADRALNDYNTLAAQVLEHGRDRQLTAISSLLGPVLQPTFGGPFTQGSSGFENLLGGIGSVAGLGWNPFHHKSSS